MADGVGDGTTGSGQPDKPAWIAQLPDALKGNEAFTAFKTIGDLAQSHLDVSGRVKELDGITAKHKELETRLQGSILKLPENATDQERDVYYLSLGRPEKAEDYVLPKPDGGESD